MIEYVGDEESLRLPKDNIMRIDAGGKYILPGFIDSHIHIMANGFKMEDTIYTPLSLYFYRAIRNLRLTINAGITTIQGKSRVGTNAIPMTMNANIKYNG